MNNKILSYVIITPAKNEEQYIEFTINSVRNQTLRPKEWVIVDDGSTDNTSNIVEKFSTLYDWIKLIKKNTENEERSVGSKVIRAFNTGLNHLSTKEFDFIVKLDADLTLPSNYFDTIASEFLNKEKVGICGGICMIEENGKLMEEKSAEYHIRGPIKSYRKECFQEIGGLMPVFGWDGIDEFVSMYYGWELKKLNELKVIHQRKTGEETGQFFYSMRIGDFCYKIGYDPLLVMLRSYKRTVGTKIDFLSGIGVLVGYFKAFFSPKMLLKEQRKFIRSFQYRRIKELFKI